MFKATYGLEMDMALDTANWAEALGARWTPEVFVLDASDAVVYRGRINDRYFAPGKRRPKTRKRDLDVALRSCLAGDAVKVPVTDAVGCPIEGVRLSIPQD